MPARARPGRTRLRRALTMATYSLGAIAEAVGGELSFGSRPPESGAGHEVAGYSIDSRTVRPGDLFFAIVGPRHDGHRFVGEAVARGARAAVVARGAGAFAETPALIRVSDTTRALQDLGAHLRRRRPLRVVGITGSAGKTTAKELAAAVMGGRYRTHRSEGNLNNAYGLPLTLLRMRDDAEAAVLEMGMSHEGEIARLVEIADPDAGVLLNVLRVHLEHFGSLERIARAKGELFRSMRRDAVAVFNADDPPAARLGRAFPGARLPFGIASRAAEVSAEEIALEGIDSVRFVLRRGAERVPVRLGMAGRHSVYNALAAAAIGFWLGVDARLIARRLASVRPPPMRGVLHRLPNGVELLDESYNSNPSAMERIIDLLRGLRPRGRRVLVSGDMLELGPYGRTAHARLGESVAAAGIELFVAVGELSARAAAAARAAGGACEVHHFGDSDAAASFVAAALRDGDLVLVKGSRGVAMERVVLAVRAAAGPPAAGAGGEH